MPIPSPTDVKDRRRRGRCCRVVAAVGFVLRNAKKNRGIAEMMVREASVPTSFKVCRRFSPLDTSMIEERTSPMCAADYLFHGDGGPKISGVGGGYGY